MPEIPGDMPTDEFRRSAHAAVDWVADYLERVGDLPVLAQVEPGDVAGRLPAEPPLTGQPMARILDDVDDIVLPGITHWNHPRFLAYFAVTGSGPGILGELLAAALNVNGMLWRTSPSATELEQVALDWLRQMLGLDDALHGIIMDTASMATFVALAAAREQAVPDVRTRGLAGRDLPPLVVYTSEQAHSSVDKAAIALGLGHDCVRHVDTDRDFRLEPRALDDAITGDLRAGRVPVAVVATVGTTSTTSIDPVPEIGEVVARHAAASEREIWLHVDGAYGGTAAIVPEQRHVLAGAEHADSLVVNPHKWLFTPIDCSAFFVRDPGALKTAFSLVPEYLRTADAGVENYMDWGVQLGRRFRALKLWMVMRYFGHEGLADRIRGHIALAAEVAAWIDEHDGFERLAPTPLSVVCFRATFAGHGEEETNARNEALLEAVNATGRAYLSHTVLRGRYTLRIAIGNLRTTRDDVREVLDILDASRSEIAGG